MLFSPMNTNLFLKKVAIWRDLGRPTQFDMILKLAKLYVDFQKTPTAPNQKMLSGFIDSYFSLYVEV